MTLTTTAQIVPATSVPPDKEMEPEAAVAVAVPPHVEVNALGVETTSPAGSVSVNATPVKSVPPGLVRVNVSEVEVFTPIVALPKAIAMTGATLIGATSVAESLLRFGSPATLTVAVFVTLFGGAVAVT